MLQGELVSEKTLILRELQQEGTFTLKRGKVKIEMCTIIGGVDHGCPVITIRGRSVVWHFKDLAEEAIKVMQEQGVLK